MVKQLDIAEAVYAAMIGSTYDKNRKNLKAYKRWTRSLIRRIKMLNGQDIETLWDRMSKRRKSNKLSR